LGCSKQGSLNWLKDEPGKIKGERVREALLLKGLSNREIEIAQLVAKGMTNKQIADHLFIVEKTVKFHLTNIYKKMSVRSRAQLIVWSLPHLAVRDTEPTPAIEDSPGTGIEQLPGHGLDRG
jgi:DNA-binding NarL/FixJ family response regulator